MGLKRSTSINKFVVAGSIVLFLIIVALAINNGAKPQNSNQGGTEEQLTNNPEETPLYTQEPQHHFDEKTRLLTSPELAGSDRNEWDLFRFRLKVPEGWRVDNSNSMYWYKKLGYQLSINKEDIYFVTINYGDGYGPGGCGNTFTIVNSGIGPLREVRLSTDQVVSFSYCQENKYGQWSTATKLDQISILARTNNVDNSMIEEARSVIESLKVTPI